MKKILTLVLILCITFLLTVGILDVCNRNEPNTIIEATGKFYHTMELTDVDGNEDVYYQFRSNDNTVWWLLTESEIGFIPDYNTTYTLTYDDNGTTKTNKPCDCGSEIDCECEVYDDTFISLK